MANAGRVAIVPKGDYSSSTAYKRLDLVRYNEKAYVAKKANTGVAPTNTEYWMLMTSDGITIDTALSDTSTNPVQNKVIKTAIDNIQTTSRATLSTAGWYRVAEYTSDTNGAKGLYANACKLFIKTVANNNTNESIELLLSSVLNEQRITALSVRRFSTTYKAFTKCRYTYEGTKAYLEVYYNENFANPCIFTVSDANDYYCKWKAITPTLTSETVSGVTVTTTYDIPANASPVTDLDLAQVDGTALLTTSILAKAVELADGFHSYRLGGSSYTGSDLPATEYRYSSAEIYKRGSNSIVVVLYPNANGTAKKIQYNIYESSWLGWNELPTTADLANYLPKSGGTITGDNTPIKLKRNSTSGGCYVQFENTNGILGLLGVGNNKPIFTDKDGYNQIIHHDGNSAKVAIQESAPSDTTALWVDTANNKVKAYKDGAWTAMA